MAKEQQLAPGDLLFDEGAQSNSLYYIKSGTIRIFKRKSTGNIEIETLRSGQLVGELSFLDNNPRSASAEAIVTSVVVEISRAMLDEALSKLPEWFSTLTKTITARLRTASNRIKMLESASATYEVDKYGNRSKEYTYVTTSELLRFCTALLVVGSRYGKEVPGGVEFQKATLDRFASNILQVNASKLVELCEVFRILALIKNDNVLTDLKFIDQAIVFLNEQNLVEPSKKRVLSDRGYAALVALWKENPKATVINEKKSKVDFGPALKAANLTPSNLQELYDQKFVDAINLESAESIPVEYDGSKLKLEFRIFSLLHYVDKLNDQKRKA